MKKFLIIFFLISFFINAQLKIKINSPLILNLTKKQGEGEPVETKAKIYSDGESLYFIFDCKEPNIKDIKCEKKENDTEIWNDDSVEIFIKPEIDKKGEYFQIIVNTLGKIYDKFLSPSIAEWNSKCEVKTDIKNDGYVIEVKLPISSLKFNPEKNKWKINLCRNRKTVLQYYTFCGWYHKEEEWKEFDLSEIKLSKIKPNPIFPISVYTYDINKLKDISKKLNWIKEERIRGYCGWLTNIERRPEYKHNIYQVIDKIDECKFNLIVLRYYPYKKSPSLNGESLLAMLYAKKKGLKVCAHLGYIGNIEVGKYNWWIDENGDIRSYWSRNLPSLFDENFWKDRFYKVIKELIDFEKKENIDIFDGVMIDLEPYRGGIDFSDIVFYEFLKRRGIDEKVDLKKRKIFLLKKKLLDEYRIFLEDYLAEILSKFRDKIHKEKEIFFALYPFNDWYIKPEDSWWQVGICKGLGKKEIPFFVWDDNCYWTGFTGNQKLPEKGQKFLREKLGYEGIFLTSIDYITYPRYPQYSPEKAGEEYYYLLRTGPGAWLYGENNPERGKNIWENHLPYWEYFKKANEKIYKEGIIKKVENERPDKNYILKIDKLMEKIKERMKNDWLKNSGVPYYISDPECKIETKENKMIIEKKLNGYEKLECDLVYNGTKAEYKFDIPNFSKIKKLNIEIEGKMPFNPEGGILIVKINGIEMERKKWEKEYIKNRWEIPISYIKKEGNIIEISYFERENVFETIYDTNFYLKSIKMEAEI
ncbi:MAG: hypothetical protein NC926_02985 [Candidatus Omnitrophica bacterium]|nr:hypothetical protein [Candidatus Omnitrophota bacterium]